MKTYKALCVQCKKFSIIDIPVPFRIDVRWTCPHCGYSKNICLINIHKTALCDF